MYNICTTTPLNRRSALSPCQCGHTVQNYRRDFATAGVAGTFRSFKTRLRIFPVGLFGIASMNSMPPSSHLYLDATDATCCKSPRVSARRPVGRSRTHLVQFLLCLRDEGAVARERGRDVRLEHNVRARRLTVEFVWDGDDGRVCDVGMIE